MTPAQWPAAPGGGLHQLLSQAAELAGAAAAQLAAAYPGRVTAARPPNARRPPPGPGRDRCRPRPRQPRPSRTPEAATAAMHAARHDTLAALEAADAAHADADAADARTQAAAGHADAHAAVVQELLPRSDGEQVNPVGPRHRNSLAGKPPTSPVIFRQRPPDHQRPATCAASRRAWFPHVARQRTGRRAGLRHGATLRPSGAAHHRPSAGPTPSAQRARARAPSLPSANARPCPAGPGSWEWIGSPARDWTTCKCGNSPWREWSPGGRVVIRQQESRDRRDWYLPR